MKRPIVPSEILQRANSRGDMVTLAACLVSIAVIGAGVLLIGLVAALSVPDYLLNDSLDNYFGTLLSVGFLVIAGVIVLLIITRMMRQMYLGNALQVEYSDYRWLRVWANQVAQDFAMPKVEIMVTQDPYMNAFAFGFMQPYTIVLNSGSIRYLNKQQLKAIVVHEMAHIRYRHAQIGTYSMILRQVPLMGGLFSWILDFWSRRIELTADRLALWYLQDPEVVKMALIRVYVGPDVANSFNEVARQWQVYMTHNTLNHVTQTFSNHPFLVRRLEHIDRVYDRDIRPLIEEEAPDAPTS